MGHKSKHGVLAEFYSPRICSLLWQGKVTVTAKLFENVFLCCNWNVGENAYVAPINLNQQNIKSWIIVCYKLPCFLRVDGPNSFNTTNSCSSNCLYRGRVFSDYYINFGFRNGNIRSHIFFAIFVNHQSNDDPFPDRTYFHTYFSCSRSIKLGEKKEVWQLFLNFLN